jgi:hypothetical protein
VKCNAPEAVKSSIEARTQEHLRRTSRPPLSEIATIVQSYARARFELRGPRRGARVRERCMLGSLVDVRDDDGRRVEPVHIGDDVWIAYGAVVEPGGAPRSRAGRDG